MARGASRAPGPCVLLRRNAGESSRRIWYGVVAGLCQQSRASSSWPANWAWQSYEVYGSKDREVVQPSTVHRLPSLYPVAARRSLPPTGRPHSSMIHRTVRCPPSQAIANHLSQSINHNQEPLVRGQQIGLGRSYGACGCKDRELAQPSTVHRWPSLYPVGGSPIFATHWPTHSSTIHRTGQQIGLGRSYGACGCKDRELAQPSTVHRWPSLYPVGGSPIFATHWPDPQLDDPSHWPANWARQLLRGLRMQRSRARAAVHRLPSTVGRLCIQWAAR